GLVSLGGTLVNPYGVRVWTYVVSLTTDPTVSARVAEWGPPSIRSATGALFFVSVLATFAFLGTRSEPPRPTALVGACVFALIGMAALRGVVWWAMAAPVLIAHVSGRVSEARSTRSWVHFAFLAALALLLAVSIPIDRGVVPSSGAPSVLTYAPQELLPAPR